VFEVAFAFRIELAVITYLACAHGRVDGEFLIFLECDFGIQVAP
jgi:hypothetical protein